MKKTIYKTDLEEAKKAFELADEDKKIVIESKDKVVIVCVLSKEQAKKIKRKL